MQRSCSRTGYRLPGRRDALPDWALQQLAQSPTQSSIHAAAGGRGFAGLPSLSCCPQLSPARSFAALHATLWLLLLQQQADKCKAGLGSHSIRCPWLRQRFCAGKNARTVCAEPARAFKAVFGELAPCLRCLAGTAAGPPPFTNVVVLSPVSVSEHRCTGNSPGHLGGDRRKEQGGAPRFAEVSEPSAVQRSTIPRYEVSDPRSQVAPANEGAGGLKPLTVTQASWRGARNCVCCTPGLAPRGRTSEKLEPPELATAERQRAGTTVPCHAPPPAQVAIMAAEGATSACPCCAAPAEPGLAALPLEILEAILGHLSLRDRWGAAQGAAKTWVLFGVPCRTPQSSTARRSASCLRQRLKLRQALIARASDCPSAGSLRLAAAASCGHAGTLPAAKCCGAIWRHNRTWTSWYGGCAALALRRVSTAGRRAACPGRCPALPALPWLQSGPALLWSQQQSQAM